MAARHQTIVEQGGTLSLDIYFYAYNGGPLTNPDSIPTWIIKDPIGTQQGSGSGTYVSTGKYTMSWSIPSGATISTEWRIEWTAQINSQTVQNTWEYFIVVSPGSVGWGNDISITENWFNKIKTVIGYPGVDLTQGDDALITEDEIKEYCVEPALREYFKKFPKREISLYEITSSDVLDIEFPDEATFGATDIKILRENANSPSGDSMLELYYFQKYGQANISSTYGIKGYNPNGLRQQQLTQLQAREAQQKSLKTEMFDVDIENRKIIAHTNYDGTVQVDWAKSSNDFADVRYQQIENVIFLAQSYLLNNISDLSGLITSDLDVNMNSDELLTKSETLRERVYGKWNEIEDIILIKL